MLPPATHGYLKMETSTYQVPGHFLITRESPEGRETAAWVLVGFFWGIFLLGAVCNPPYLCIRS